ncbi:hypothetical protein [uncultured Ramlibacter sp.]|uniref:hypothetical protein n=1 Tax=uncultured Ramlibacter sp. TaxID=260755 RepID=UPI0026357F24|nr:hypothetical protein [uncultured Ramlibacter sp.]
MRIKKTLTSEHVLIDTGGLQLTVADLIGRRPRNNDFHPNRTGGFSIVQATYPGSVLEVQGKGFDIPAFRDEVEVRVQADVLRIAGRYPTGLFGWREGRIKLPLQDIIHTRQRGSRVDLWLRTGQAQMQRLALEMFTHDTAAALVQWLPLATPWPEPTAELVPVHAPHVPVAAPAAQVLWVSLASVVLVVGVVLTVLMIRRVY